MLNLFIGSAPSKYAAMAIFAAILVVSVTMLLGKEPVPLGQKLAMVLLIFLISLPGILLALFQMTCMVTGAGFISKDSPLGKRWWCSLYAWIVSAILILYSVFLVVAAIVTLTTGDKTMKDIAMADAEAFEVRMQAATQQAAQTFAAQKAEASDVTPSVVPAATAAGAVAPKKEDEKKEVVKDTFAVQGGASEPAPFEEPEGFSTCGAPF